MQLVFLNRIRFRFGTHDKLAVYDENQLVIVQSSPRDFVVGIVCTVYEMRDMHVDIQFF